MKIKLTQIEISALFQQRPETRTDGGFQSLMVNLQDAVNKPTGELDVSKKNLERIPRYAFKYGNGGWENRLKTIFGRTLGPALCQ